MMLEASHVAGLLVTILAVFIIQTTPVSGGQDVVLEGCAGSYVYLQCSDDEVIKVKDVVLSQGGSTGGDPCPEEDVPGPVPEELRHLLQSADQRYEPGICEDESECAFYVSRQDLGGKTTDKTMTLTYECSAGSGRKAGMIVLVIVGVVAFVVFIALVILLVRRHWSEEEDDYAAFANVSRSSSVHTVERQSGGAAKNGGAPDGSKDGGGEVTELQHVSVSLEAHQEEPAVQYTKA